MKVNYCKRIIVLLIFVSLILSFNTFSYEIGQQKRILMLSSYNEDMDWTKDLTDGIIDTINKAKSNCSVNVEFMDWKNYPSDDNLKYLHNYYKLKYESKRFDAIITCDDAALKFAFENRKELFSNAPIVFCGVNHESLIDIAKNYNNYTGVIEAADPTNTIKLALKINPLIKNVYIANDATESGLTTGHEFINKVRSVNNNLNIISLDKLSFKELIETLKGLSNDSIVLTATYNSDGKGNIIGYSNALEEMTRYSSVPIYHEYMFGLRYGVLGGNLTNPTLYGIYAAKMALRILEGEKADSIKILNTKAARNIVDYHQVIKYKIPISRIPSDTVIINRPFSFFKTYKMLISGVLAVFALLISFIISLLFYTNKIKKMKIQLLDTNQNLSQINEELIASDEELNSRYEEICRIQDDLQISEEKYTYLAFHDMLTGMRNRRSLFEDAKVLLVDNRVCNASIFFIDLDNFKYINDTMGHEFGDELIHIVSERLSKTIHEKCRLYRLGGDEFIVFSLNIEKKDDAKRLASEVLDCFKNDFTIVKSIIRVSASIGIAMFPEHGKNIEDLIKSADIAMYNAKAKGKNQYVVYDDSMNKDFNDRMILEKYLNLAMQRDEFKLFYQPQVNVASKKIIGFEALLRWNSAELGAVSPLKFIQVAEITHLIIPLGEWVLMQACDFLSGLHEKGYKDLRISVNISTIQLLQTDFTNIVMNILDNYGLDPQSLELEITETVLIESIDAIIDKLNLLREKGIHIALDDFGKGYSSLNYLNQLPISTLKIDKSFIDNISFDDKYKAIVNNIINMGKALGIAVIAEGVEEQEQFECLKEYKCDLIQGYLFSKPLPEEEAVKLL